MIEIHVSIPLFDRKPRHSFVPTCPHQAAASTIAGLAKIWRTASFAVAILSALLSSSGKVMAQSMPEIMVPERASAADPFANFVAEAAQRFGIPATWIQAVMTVESNGDPHALSPKGAMGLMQIMPATWADLRIRFDLGNDPFDPRANILAGTAFLRMMHDRYGSLGFLAAYSAGPGRYEDHLATGRALPAETRAYVTMLAPMIGDGRAGDATNPVGNAINPRPWTIAPLFVVRTEGTAPATPTNSRTVSVSAMAPQSDGLFVCFADVRRRP
jgi:soluble lytic murein transglycosylase-like protein